MTSPTLAVDHDVATTLAAARDAVGAVR
jgi:hypothetical protein